MRFCRHISAILPERMILPLFSFHSRLNLGDYSETSSRTENLVVGKICAVVVIFLSLTFASAVCAQCPVATVTVTGRVEQAPRNAHVRVQLTYPKKEHEESADAGLNGDVFRIPVEFLTESRKGSVIANIGRKCDRKPKAVVITLVTGDGESDRVFLNFSRDFEQSDPSNYTVRREVVLRAADR